MKINKYGTVILTQGPVQVEGWIVEREPDDPAGATIEQLLLGVAVKWAQEKLTTAKNNSTMAALNKLAHQKMLEKSLPKLVQ